MFCVEGVDATPVGAVSSGAQIGQQAARHCTSRASSNQLINPLATGEALAGPSIRASHGGQV